MRSEAAFRKCYSTKSCFFGHNEKNRPVFFRLCLRTAIEDYLLHTEVSNSAIH